jgi:hypothetical protein
MQRSTVIFWTAIRRQGIVTRNSDEELRDLDEGCANRVDARRAGFRSHRRTWQFLRPMSTHEMEYSVLPFSSYALSFHYCARVVPSF